MADSKAVRWHHLYRFGVESGFRSLFAGHVNLGLRALFNPVRSGFPRYLEIPYVLNSLGPGPGDRVLDVASPKHASLYVGVECGSRVSAIDLLSDFVDPYRKYARSLGEAEIDWRCMDGTSLEYDDESFDQAFSISALEHFTDEGDTAAVREIGRVLRPGGTLAITVPFARRAGEIFKTSNVYDREFSGEPIFFSRIYDADSLRRRIVEAGDWAEVDRRYYRSRLGIERIWEQLPRPVFMLLQSLGPLLAAAALEQVDHLGEEETGICCLTLRKRDSSSRP